MNTNEKFKSLIKKKLTKDLSHSEIILGHDGSIWLIDRKNTYWYLEFEKSGKLWWRYQFFTDFFKFFSMERSEYEPIIVEWVEDVLNGKVVSSFQSGGHREEEVEDGLNGKVVSSHSLSLGNYSGVEDALNGKVVSSDPDHRPTVETVEEVLNKNN